MTDTDPIADLFSDLDINIQSEPPQGWHVPDVWNAHQLSQQEIAFTGMIKHLVNEGRATRLAHYLARLTRKIERYERELKYVDARFDTWVYQEVAKIVLVGDTNRGELCVPVIRCPQCTANISSVLVEHVRDLKTHYPLKKREHLKKLPPIKVVEETIRI